MSASHSNKSEVLSIRLRADQRERLRHFARELGSTPSEAAARLVEEGLRRAEFAFIEFRSSRSGRHAYVQGSRLPVWQVVMIARSYAMAPKSVAKHLQWPDARVEAALNYYSVYSQEIEEELACNDRYDFDKLKRLLPGLRAFESKASTGAVAESEASYDQSKHSKTVNKARKSSPPGKSAGSR